MTRREWRALLRATDTGWPDNGDDLDDRAAQAEALTFDEITARRLARTVARHPAGKAVTRPDNAGRATTAPEG